MMLFTDIINQLNDLPNTFKRPGTPYTQIIDALATGLLLFSQGIDFLQSEATNFNNSLGPWVDTWGALVNVQRRTNESDILYKNRIQTIVLAVHATPLAMINWLKLVELISNPQIIEASQPAVNPVGVIGLGYSVVLPANLTTAQLNLILAGLAYVRPAGVPFTFSTESGATYLGTVNFIGDPRTTGAYLANSAIPAGVSLASAYNNTLAILPDLLLTDPLINPP